MSEAMDRVTKLVLVYYYRAVSMPGEAYQQPTNAIESQPVAELRELRLGELFPKLGKMTCILHCHFP